MISAVHSLYNLPRRTIEGGLSNNIEGGIAKCPTGTYIEIHCGGWKCCDDLMFDDNAKQIAVTIAKIIELALDVGFEQGREYVRKALGVKQT